MGNPSDRDAVERESSLCELWRTDRRPSWRTKHTDLAKSLSTCDEVDAARGVHGRTGIATITMATYSMQCCRRSATRRHQAQSRKKDAAHPASCRIVLSVDIRLYSLLLSSRSRACSQASAQLLAFVQPPRMTLRPGSAYCSLLEFAYPLGIAAVSTARAAELAVPAGYRASRWSRNLNGSRLPMREGRGVPHCNELN